MQRTEPKRKWWELIFWNRVRQILLTILAVAFAIPAALQAQDASTELWIKAFDDVWKKAWEKVEEEAFAKVEDDSALPRVLLIGDSISMAYTGPARRLLKGIANVHHPPSNCASTVVGLEHLSDWLGNGRWDAIHFNWGLHDLKKVDGRNNVPLDQYRKNLQELVQKLKATGATLIWATTTPVPDKLLEGSPARNNQDVIAYNTVARELMLEHQVLINDLYTLALPYLREIQVPGDVHFLFKGSEILAEQVADSVAQSMEDQSGLPRVLLMGDSITNGYRLPVRKLLKGKANVRSVVNGGPTTLWLQKLDEWLGDGKWDVIHFNWGLNDLEFQGSQQRVLSDQYEKNLQELVRRLKKTGARLIWASTTPVPTGRVDSPRDYRDVPIYNNVAKQIMAQNQIEIDDLYGFALPRLREIQYKENVHFTDQGSAVLAQEVARHILKVFPGLARRQPSAH